MPRSTICLLGLISAKPAPSEQVQTSKHACTVTTSAKPIPSCGRMQDLAFLSACAGMETEQGERSTPFVVQLTSDNGKLSYSLRNVAELRLHWLL